MQRFTKASRFAAAILALAAPSAARAQSPSELSARLPFAVGEELIYRAAFAGVGAGTARMRVTGVDTVRGRPAYHVVFTIDGGVAFFRVHDRYESWIDVETLSSLRHRQQISEGRYRRTTEYEIYPEQAQYRKNDDSTRHASVKRPLDDGSFIYAVRVAGVRVGETRRDDRYFRPDRNPVVLTGVRRDTVTVPAGRFAAIVVAPTIRTKGLFSEGGRAEVWLSDDEYRYPVQLRSHFSKFSLTLTLQSVVPGGATELASRSQP